MTVGNRKIIENFGSRETSKHAVYVIYIYIVFCLVKIYITAFLCHSA